MAFSGLYWPFLAFLAFLALLALLAFLAFLAFSIQVDPVDLQINLDNLLQPLTAFAGPYRPFWPFLLMLI
jgi:hypothetical protein